MMYEDRYPQQSPVFSISGASVVSAPRWPADPLPQLPIMVATRLQLELLLNDSVIDLRAVAEVILADAGATLQILRCIGEEYPNESDRPHRIEDCIISLSMERCYQIVCASNITCPGLYVTEWQRCRRIAERARELAGSFDGLSSEQAYLVGLLCRLGTFPHLLGWNDKSSDLGEQEALGVMLASHWHLPDYLLSAIREKQEAVSSPKWEAILMLADSFAEQSAA